jgi:hypothetical protein
LGVNGRDALLQLGSNGEFLAKLRHQVGAGGNDGLVRQLLAKAASLQNIQDTVLNSRSPVLATFGTVIS